MKDILSRLGVEVSTRLNLTEIIELLKGTTVFSILSQEELEQFASRFEFVHFTLGQTISRAGDEADAFFVVYSGRARVVGANALGEEVTVGTLSRGNSFGEQAILTGSTRRFTVRAAEDLALLRLSRNDFERLLKEHEDLRGYFEKYISEISIRNFLKLSTVLSPLSAQEIRELLGALETREFTTDEAIVREGDEGDAFYILRSGSAKVIIGVEGDGSRIVNRLKPGDTFGELALLTGQPRAASVIADERSCVFRREKREFERIVAAAPRFKEAIVSVASGYGDAALRDAEAESAQTASSTDELSEAPTSVEEPIY